MTESLSTSYSTNKFETKEILSFDENVKKAKEFAKWYVQSQRFKNEIINYIKSTNDIQCNIIKNSDLQKNQKNYFELYVQNKDKLHTQEGLLSNKEYKDSKKWTEQKEKDLAQIEKNIESNINGYINFLVDSIEKIWISQTNDKISNYNPNRNTISVSKKENSWVVIAHELHHAIQNNFQSKWNIYGNNSNPFCGVVESLNKKNMESFSKKNNFEEKINIRITNTGNEYIQNMQNNIKKIAFAKKIDSMKFDENWLNFDDKDTDQKLMVSMFQLKNFSLLSWKSEEEIFKTYKYTFYFMQMKDYVMSIFSKNKDKIWDELYNLTKDVFEDKIENMRLLESKYFVSIQELQSNSFSLKFEHREKTWNFDFKNSEIIKNGETINYMKDFIHTETQQELESFWKSLRDSFVQRWWISESASNTA